MDFTTYEPRISALEAGGGGGGDSELSKAKVTLKTDDPSLQGEYLFLPVCVDAEPPVVNAPALFLKSVPFNGGTVDIALYKGECQTNENLYDAEAAQFEISGNAEARWVSATGAWAFRITGDCTIKLVSR